MIKVNDEVVSALEFYALRADTRREYSMCACGHTCQFNCDESCWCESDMGF